MEARDERRLLCLQEQFAGYNFLIIDEFGFVHMSKIAADLLFEMFFFLLYVRGLAFITSTLPFAEWIEPFGTEQLTGAPIDCLTLYVSIHAMNGDSCRLAQGGTKELPQAE